ncbi:PI-PLC X domain-containing protein At5g67130-like [Papaver somniferum]|uniref:PI-PLC X domain-containing protein At5g67130-like n=1 Tax=Papaver somniferum TaxID=3469 RepID=UPI000E6F89CB|nr:PI-PLC X domain-containing protein At5g67130-like [Papaver somniferum]
MFGSNNFMGQRRKCLVLLFLFMLQTLFFSNSLSACLNGSCQLAEPCSMASDCGSGLFCGNCPPTGNTQPICIRGQVVQPTSIMKGLPFNKYSWLVTHNSFSIVNAPLLLGVQRVTFYNQEDTVTNQLMNGVRGLMLDMYDFEDDIWLCHSLRGQCFNFTAFEPALNTLKEVEAFLSKNPTEIVTIIIEDYVHTPNGLTKVFTAAGLQKYLFPVSKMPKNGEDWPTVTDMVADNHRLLVFTSIASKEADEGIAYQWRYMVENDSGDPGIVQGTCPHRPESEQLNSRKASLFFQNYFPTYPVEDEACKEHSVGLYEMVGACYKASAGMMPNFLGVNFYMRSNGGGAFDVVDRMNGQSLCGCSTITACQAGEHVGSCKNTTSANKSPSATANGHGSFDGYVQLSGSSSPAHFMNIIIFNLIYFSIVVTLL